MWHVGGMAQICPLVSVADRARLEAIVADRNRAQEHVPRARIILGSAAPLSAAEATHCTAQIRCTERSEMPLALAIARPIQCVASPGGSAQVRVTTRCTV